MKKLLITLILAIFAGISTEASIIYRTPCGHLVQTVGPEYFDTPEEAAAFYKELDELLCGVDDEDHENQPDNGDGNNKP